MSKSKQSESSAFSIERIVPSFLKAESIIAGPNYNRWLFPPAALLIQLSIGQAYAFSVFNKVRKHRPRAASRGATGRHGG